MIKLIAAIFFTTAVSATSHASPSEKYPVSPLAWELHVERVGDVLFRYVRFLSESDYPCLRLETFEPINLKLLSRQDICKLRARNEMIDVRNDVSGAFFEKFKLEGKVFHFAADIILRRPGSYYLECKVDISDKGKLSEPICKEGQRPHEPEEKK